MAERQAAGPVVAPYVGALAGVREALLILRRKHAKKACEKRGPWILIPEATARTMISDLAAAEEVLARLNDAD